MTFRWTSAAPLLRGEVADSHNRDDVEHWVAVYAELTRFLGESGAPDDMVDRYRGRLQFWRGRLNGLVTLPTPEWQWREAVE